MLCMLRTIGMQAPPLRNPATSPIELFIVHIHGPPLLPAIAHLPVHQLRAIPPLLLRRRRVLLLLVQALFCYCACTFLTPHANIRRCCCSAVTTSAACRSHPA